MKKTTQNRLIKALEPFAQFASLRGFHQLPDDQAMTVGSPIAATQVTAGDFKEALIVWALAKSEN